MFTQAIVTLESLHCIRESDLAGKSHSEPYIWPFLAIVSNNSFETTPIAAILSNSRSVIKNEMRAGETAPISYPLNTLIANFQDDQLNRKLILVVGLWEQDETPATAIQAGYQAFLDGLHAAIGSNLPALTQVVEADQKKIMENIKTTVYNKVSLAVENKLSTWEKTKLYLGWLNLDDFMGSDFKYFSKIDPNNFSLNLKGFAGDLKILKNPPVEYEIKGSLKIEPVTVNVCQAQIDAFNVAEDVFTGFEYMIKNLQDQLHRASPSEKSGIAATIEKINTEEIPRAKEALDKAKAALEKCKALHTHIPDHPPVSPSLG